MRIILIVFMAVLSAFALSQHTLARGSAVDVKGKIVGNFETFETILNAKAAPEVLMDFLHETISHSAEFHVLVENTEIQGKAPEQIKLDKADYINSYLYGPRQIEDYKADIKVLDITLSDDSKAASSKEILTERGMMKDPMNPDDYARGFVSRTQCQSDYVMNDAQEPVLETSVCHTQIMFEQGV